MLTKMTTGLLLFVVILLSLNKAWENLEQAFVFQRTSLWVDDCQHIEQEILFLTGNSIPSAKLPTIFILEHCLLKIIPLIV